MSRSTSASRTRGGASVRLAGTLLERWGWVLVGVWFAVLILFALTSSGAGARSDRIDGSGCCNGHSYVAAPLWTFQYANETFGYQATFQFGMGLFGLLVVLTALRRGRRWAWLACWYVPIMFAIHAFVLGSGLFDVVTGSIALLGQLLMIRPVFGRRGVHTDPADEPRPAGAATPVR